MEEAASVLENASVFSAPMNLLRWAGVKFSMAVGRQDEEESREEEEEGHLSPLRMRTALCLSPLIFSLFYASRAAGHGSALFVLHPLQILLAQ